MFILLDILTKGEYILENFISDFECTGYDLWLVERLQKTE